MFKGNYFSRNRDMQNTLSEIQNQFFAELNKDTEATCPCCHRYAKIYKRTLHKTIIKQLLSLYNAGGDDHYIHSLKFNTETTSGKDFGIAEYWGLIKRYENTNSTTKTSGMWMLTNKGILFLRGEMVIPKWVYIWNGKPLNFSQEVINIKDIHSEFNYREMMGERVLGIINNN